MIALVTIQWVGLAILAAALAALTLLRDKKETP